MSLCVSSSSSSSSLSKVLLCVAKTYQTHNKFWYRIQFWLILPKPVRRGTQGSHRFQSLAHRRSLEKQAATGRIISYPSLTVGQASLSTAQNPFSAVSPSPETCPRAQAKDHTVRHYEMAHGNLLLASTAVEVPLRSIPKDYTFQQYLMTDGNAPTALSSSQARPRPTPEDHTFQHYKTNRGD